MEEKLCATVTRLQSHVRFRRTVPTRAGRSTHVGNQGSSSVASSSGLMKMYLHQVLLAVDTTAVDTTAVDLVVVRAAVTEVEMGERKQEMLELTELLLLRNHETVASVTCPDTRESPAHSGDAQSFYLTNTSASTVSFNT